MRFALRVLAVALPLAACAEPTNPGTGEKLIITGYLETGASLRAKLVRGTDTMTIDPLTLVSSPAVTLVTRDADSFTFSVEGTFTLRIDGDPQTVPSVTVA